MSFENVIGWIAATIAFLLAARATRAATLQPSEKDGGEFANPGFRVVIYLISAGLGFYYPVGDDPVRWAHLVLIAGAGAGFFSTRFNRQ